MRYLVTVGHVGIMDNVPHAIASLTIDMPDDYNLYEDSAYGKYDTLKVAFMQNAAKEMYLHEFTDKNAPLKILAVSSIPYQEPKGGLGGLFDKAAGSSNAAQFL